MTHRARGMRGVHPIALQAVTQAPPPRYPQPQPGYAQQPMFAQGSPVYPPS